MAYDTTPRFPQTAPTDDAWKITSEVHDKHAIQRHLRNTKREDLIESTGVVPAEYLLNVKLELLTTVEC